MRQTRPCARSKSRLRARLRGLLCQQGGTTLVELIVCAALLCLLITMFAGALHPAAEMSRRLQDMNHAQLIADDLLETIRADLEQAQGYVKCYADGAPDKIVGATGAAEGAAIEFRTGDGYVILMTAQGCPDTDLRRTASDGAGGTTETVTPMQAIPAGRLLLRYYYSADGTSYTYTRDGKPVAQGLTSAYGSGFYMGFTASLHFAVDDAAHTVTVTVTLTRPDGTELLADHLLVDLRNQPPLRTAPTARADTTG